MGFKIVNEDGEAIEEMRNKSGDDESEGEVGMLNGKERWERRKEMGKGRGEGEVGKMCRRRGMEGRVKGRGVN